MHTKLFRKHYSDIQDHHHLYNKTLQNNQHITLHLTPLLYTLRSDEFNQRVDLIIDGTPITFDKVTNDKAIIEIQCSIADHRRGGQKSIRHTITPV